LERQDRIAELAAEFEEYTKTIINECLRCKDIVQTLLTFSRPVASSLNPVDINQCVTDTLFILKHHFKAQQNIMVRTDLAPQLR
jgi:nitrogen fixation/metabolism regulation signal transduction histidine kinase